MSLHHKVGSKARRGRKRNPLPHKSHRKATTYSRVGRLLKQRIALKHAPTIAEGLSEGDVYLKLRPARTGRLLIMAGATGLSADYTHRASAAPAASPPKDIS